MTDSEILDFCEEHDIEVSFRFEKEINGCHLRLSLLRRKSNPLYGRG